MPSHLIDQTVRNLNAKYVLNLKCFTSHHMDWAVIQKDNFESISYIDDEIYYLNNLALKCSD